MVAAVQEQCHLAVLPNALLHVSHTNETLLAGISYHMRGANVLSAVSSHACTMAVSAGGAPVVHRRLSIFSVTKKPHVHLCSRVALFASKKSVPAEQQLQEHFSNIYGPDRWKALWQAMQRPTQHVAFASPWTSDQQSNNGSSQTRSTAAEELCRAAGWKKLHPSLPFYLVGRPHTAHQPNNETTSRSADSSSNVFESSVSSTGSSEGEVDHATDDALPEDLSQLGHTAVDAASGCRLLYFLDLASALPALALAPQPGMQVLDMCAAPGGKSLLLASQLFGQVQLIPQIPATATDDTPAVLQAHPQPEQLQQHTSTADMQLGAVAAAADRSRLVSNDRSPARRARLRTVLQSYLPQQLHHQLTVTGHDATRWHHHQPASYQAILLDAPCSSERHLAQRGSSSSSSSCAAITREDWSPSRSKRNASTQLALLVSAGQCLAAGGRLVYSTCSISPTENDQVVEKGVAKLAKLGVHLTCSTASSWQQLQAAGLDMPGIETQGLGMWALPDRTGWGPLYWCVLDRL